MFASMKEALMVTSALREQDVLFTPKLLRDAFDDVPAAGAGCAERSSELSTKLHRQAAMSRSGRLRTIEALRRPAKS
jgi:hypothetical protein